MYTTAMSSGLVRFQQSGLPHFVTFSCVRHRPLLGTPEARDTFCALLERTRELYAMDVYGYVVIPDHVHLIVSEPEKKQLSVALQILKQRYSRTRAEEYVWEARYYDFNVHSVEKRVEKLQYVHRNPVKRGLVEHAENWKWSSYRDYMGLGAGPVTVKRPSW